MGRSVKATVARWKRVARTDEGAWRPAVKKISQANPLSWKPQVWLGAVLAAVVPISAVTWKTYRSNPSVALAPQVSQRQSQSTDSALNKSFDGVAENSSQANSFAGIQAWFEGSANPFLTTAQANDRKVRDALAKVEASLRRRGDVEDVFILVSEGAIFSAKKSANADKSSDAIDAPARKPKAVVSIRMRAGSLPIALADCAGSLVSAALVNVNAEDVEVIDARDGARVRARSLDFNASAQGREILAVAAQCEEQEIQGELQQTEASTLLDQSNQIEDGLAHRFNSPTNHSAQEVADPSVSGKNNSPLVLIHSTDATNAAMGWWWCVTAIGVAVAVGLAVWTWKKFLSPSVRGTWKKSATSSIDHCNNHLRAAANNSAGPAAMGPFEIWSAPLSCALHACVAEKPALIAATLIERLESQPSSRQEVARLMLELEPWAAERILAVLPNHSLDILEKSIKQPATAATPQQVRALAEAMISLRNAA